MKSGELETRRSAGEENFTVSGLRKQWTRWQMVTLALLAEGGSEMAVIRQWRR